MPQNKNALNYHERPIEKKVSSFVTFSFPLSSALSAAQLHPTDAISFRINKLFQLCKFQTPGEVRAPAKEEKAKPLTSTSVSTAKPSLVTLSGSPPRRCLVTCMLWCGDRHLLGRSFGLDWQILPKCCHSRASLLGQILADRQRLSETWRLSIPSAPQQ